MNPLKLAGLAAAGITVAALVAVPQAHAAAASSALPAFTVVNTGGTLTVYHTGTSTKAGSVSSPTGLQFQGVASGGTTSSFLAAVGTQYPQPCHAWFYKFTLSPAGTPSKLTLLRSIAGSLPTALSASPGGGTIAYSAVHCAGATAPRAGTTPIGVVTTISKSGATRSWTYDLAEDYPASLALPSSAKSIALPEFTGPLGTLDQSGLLLNMASTAKTVAGASKIVLRTGNPSPIAISADGKTLYACTVNSLTSATKYGIVAYSAATGRQVKVLRSWTASAGQSFRCQISTDASGNFLLAAISGSASTLIGYNLITGASVRLPAHTLFTGEGNQVAW